MKNKIKKIQKKGVSPIITTILLILVSIIAAVMIAGIIIPFVRNSLSESKECFEIIDQLTINTESGYTCHYDDAGSKIANLTIKRGMKEVDIEGFIIAVSGGGNSKTFEIKEGTIENVKMINGSQTLEIPQRGEERTYSITTNLEKIEYAEIAPIIKDGKTCRISDKAEINVCS